MGCKEPLPVQPHLSVSGPPRAIIGYNLIRMPCTQHIAEDATETSSGSGNYNIRDRFSLRLSIGTTRGQVVCGGLHTEGW